LNKFGGVYISITMNFCNNQLTGFSKFNPHEDPPGRLLGDMRKHVLEKIVGSERGKRKYPARRCHVCAAHKKRSEIRYICKFCLVPLHKGECFQRYHIL